MINALRAVWECSYSQKWVSHLSYNIVSSYQLGFIEIVAVYLACWYCGGSWVHYVTVQNLASAEESVTY